MTIDSSRFVASDMTEDYDFDAQLQLQEQEEVPQAKTIEDIHMSLCDLLTDPESTVPSLVQGVSRLLPALLGLVDEQASCLDLGEDHSYFYRAKVSLDVQDHHHHHHGETDSTSERSNEHNNDTDNSSVGALPSSVSSQSPNRGRRVLPRFPMDVVSDNTVDRRKEVFLTEKIPYPPKSPSRTNSIGKIEIFCYDVCSHHGSANLDRAESSQPQKPTLKQVAKLRQIAARLGKVIENRRRQQDRAQNLNDLQEANRRLVESQNLAQVGQWELDLTSNSLYWSDAIYTLFRVDKERFGASYEAFLDAIHPDDREVVNDAYTKSLQTKQSYDIVHRLLFKTEHSHGVTEEVRWVREICRTEYDEMNGKPLYSVGIVQDITDERLAKDECERLSYLKSKRKIHFTSDNRWSNGCNSTPHVPLSTPASHIINDK